MKLEELSQYGKPLGLPKKAQRKQVGIVFSALRKKFGFIGMVPFVVSVLAEQRRIRKAHPDLVAKARMIGPEVAKEMEFREQMAQPVVRAVTPIVVQRGRGSRS